MYYSHTSEVMLKILQARLQQYVNHELPEVEAGFRKGRGTRDQIANICWIIEKAREFQKNTDFCFIDYAKAFDCVDHNKLWKILNHHNYHKLQLFTFVFIYCLILRQSFVSLSLSQFSVCTYVFPVHKAQEIFIE